MPRPPPPLGSRCVVDRPRHTTRLPRPHTHTRRAGAGCSLRMNTQQGTNSLLSAARAEVQHSLPGGLQPSLGPLTGPAVGGSARMAQPGSSVHHHSGGGLSSLSSFGPSSESAGLYHGMNSSDPLLGTGSAPRRPTKLAPIQLGANLSPNGHSPMPRMPHLPNATLPAAQPGGLPPGYAHRGL